MLSRKPVPFLFLLLVRRHRAVVLLSSLQLLTFVHVGVAQSFPNPAPVGSSAIDAGAALPDAPLPQSAGLSPGDLGVAEQVTLRKTPMNLLKDQAAIWTSPARIRGDNFLLPAALVLGTTVTITVDHQIMSSSKLNDASLNSHAESASNGLLGGFIAAPAIIYVLGYIHHDDHATETGILAGEAMADSLVVNEVLKSVSLRERPTVDNDKGKFFQSSVGTGSSFASTHSILAWSSAAVIASEYDGPMTQLTAYGLAAGVSLTRILARQHFPSDVLVGSAVGWMVGRYVCHKHGKFF
jgi:hypothetical protein